jgi:hypothetical protein
LILVWRDKALVKTPYSVYDKEKHQGDFAFCWYADLCEQYYLQITGGNVINFCKTNLLLIEVTYAVTDVV